MTPEADIQAQYLIQVLVTIGLTILMGIERQEKESSSGKHVIAGVRTFPIVGLLGYSLSLVSPQAPMAVALGFLAVAALAAISYIYKIQSGAYGATTEFAVLAAYLVGALVAHDLMWVAVAITAAVSLLLATKTPLQNFAARMPKGEITTFVRFLILTAVILPVLPNQAYTQFELNPFRIWLVVAVVSGISYASYIMRKLLQDKSSLLLTALLGGMYSSTMTTVVLAKRSTERPDRRLYPGLTLLSSSVMYGRMAILLWIFGPQVAALLSWRFLALAFFAGLVGYFFAMYTRRDDSAAHHDPEGHDEETTEQSIEESRNPLEISTALLFAALFVGISILTNYFATHLDDRWIYGLAAIVGTTDVAVFLLSVAQAGGERLDVVVGATALVVAAGMNNCMKGVYAIIFGNKSVGLVTFALLFSLFLLSLTVLIRL